MDPVTIVATAVAIGAAAGLTDTAKQSVTDAYGALKGLLTRRYRDVDLAQVEAAPDSAAQRESLAGALDAHGAAEDHELLAAARELIETAVRADVGAAGVDLAMVEAAALRISRVTATGTGVRVHGGRFSGDIHIEDIEAGAGAGAGAGDTSHPGPARRHPPTPPR
ncbi:hypothetical protein IU479_28775 [Nocardia abscessus]|uniref:hypothetical protein n=1 Tax=Nocardia abscessus TaxID=120957 RepID=UPI0018934AF2|nr:hypothetical protein [Nocardia abscessus]MBF6222090.1 hypothetical protein [Nocardia abscessus]